MIIVTRTLIYTYERADKEAANRSMEFWEVEPNGRRRFLTRSGPVEIQSNVTWEESDSHRAE